jgi:hypothetical protein
MLEFVPLLWSPIMEDESRALQGIYEGVGEQIEEEYYFKTLPMVKDLGSPAFVDGSFPFEVWKGISNRRRFRLSSNF